MDESRARLEELHRTRVTAADELVALVHEATGRTPTRTQRILQGEVNEVLAAELDDGAEVVIRIDHLGIGFAHELWAMEALRARGVPVARVVGCDASAARCIVLERLSGRTLLELLRDERPDEGRRRSLVEGAGELLARVHQISTPGHGPIRAAGTGAFPSLGAWLDDEFARERLEAPFSLAALDRRLLDVALDELGSADDVLVAHHLVHRDFGPKHLFVGADDAIIGLIDFGRIESGDPVLDLGGWRYWFRDTMPLAWLLTGYERVAALGPQFDERLRLAELLELLHLLRHYTVGQPFPRAAQDTARRLRELLA